MKLIERLSGLTLLDRKNSKYNGELTVVRDIAWGTYIKAGGLPQSGGLARKIWKSPLKRASKINNEISNILILGFGGGGMIELITKLWPDAKITGVDIDPVIVELGRKYIKWDTLNVELVIADAEKYVASQKPKSFDLVLIDTYNGDVFPPKFETAEFASKVLKVLKNDGLAIFNRLYGYEDRQKADKFGRMLELVFTKVITLQPVANIMFITIK